MIPAVLAVEQLLRADTLSRDARYDEAIELYQKVDVRQITSLLRLQLYHNHALSFLALKKWSAALEKFQAARAAAAPDVHFAPALGCAIVYYSLEKYEEANDSINEALYKSTSLTNETRFHAFYGKACCLAKMGLLPEAELAVTQAILLDENNVIAASAYRFRAYIRGLLNRPDDEERDMLRAEMLLDSWSDVGVSEFTTRSRYQISTYDDEDTACDLWSEDNLSIKLSNELDDFVSRLSITEEFRPCVSASPSVTSSKAILRGCSQNDGHRRNPFIATLASSTLSSGSFFGTAERLNVSGSLDNGSIQHDINDHRSDQFGGSIRESLFVDARDGRNAPENAPDRKPFNSPVPSRRAERSISFLSDSSSGLPKLPPAQSSDSRIKLHRSPTPFRKFSNPRYNVVNRFLSTVDVDCSIANGDSLSPSSSYVPTPLVEAAKVSSVRDDSPQRSLPVLGLKCPRSRGQSLNSTEEGERGEATGIAHDVVSATASQDAVTQEKRTTDDAATVKVRNVSLSQLSSERASRLPRLSASSSRGLVLGPSGHCTGISRKEEAASLDQDVPSAFPYADEAATAAASDPASFFSLRASLNISMDSHALQRPRAPSPPREFDRPHKLRRSTHSVTLLRPVWMDLPTTTPAPVLSASSPLSIAGADVSLPVTGSPRSPLALAERTCEIYTETALEKKASPLALPAKVMFPGHRSLLKTSSKSWSNRALSQSLNAHSSAGLPSRQLTSPLSLTFESQSDSSLMIKPEAFESPDDSVLMKTDSPGGMESQGSNDDLCLLTFPELLEHHGEDEEKKEYSGGEYHKNAPRDVSVDARVDSRESYVDAEDKEPEKDAQASLLQLESIVRPDLAASSSTLLLDSLCTYDQRAQACSAHLTYDSSPKTSPILFLHDIGLTHSASSPDNAAGMSDQQRNRYGNECMLMLVSPTGMGTYRASPIAFVRGGSSPLQLFSPNKSSHNGTADCSENDNFKRLSSPLHLVSVSRATAKATPLSARKSSPITCATAATSRMFFSDPFSSSGLENDGSSHFETDRYQSGGSDSDFGTDDWSSRRNLPTFPYFALEAPGPYPEGVDPCNREFYLNDTDFERLFEMSKKSWSRIPLWKRVPKKQDLRLF